MTRKRLVLVVGVGLLIVVSVGLVAAGSFYAGMRTGSHRALEWLLGIQETEVSGSLNHAIHALTFMRNGEVDRAISVYETRVHAAVVSLSQSRDWQQLPASTRRNLVLAKHYLAVFPIHSESEEVPEDLREVLQWIPDEPLDPESCSPAVRFLLEGDFVD